MMRPGRPFRVTATGEAFSTTGQGDHTMVGARLQAAAAVATAVIREVDGSGAIIAELGAAIGLTDEIQIPVIFKKALHVTLTGASASCIVYV